MVLHPVVRIHVIDASTGSYIRKNPEVPATTFNESASIDYILPVMTKPFSFQKHQSTAASWNEDILLICEYLSLMKETTIIFFEILDFGTMGNNNENNDGWRHVAWAFVKLIAGHGQTNTEIPLRLQLFQYPGGHQLVNAAQNMLNRTVSRNGHSIPFMPMENDRIPFVYQCWLSGKRVPYPSTLFVEISGRPCPPQQYVTMRPRNAIEIERGKLTYEQLMDEYLSKRTNFGDPLLNITSKPVWRRLPGQLCRIPKKPHFAIHSAQASYACGYSSSGLYLAVSCFNSTEYNVKVYDAIKGEKIASIDGHQNIVYDINWASDIDIFATASADTTVRVYQSHADRLFEHSATFYHPTFAYTVCFHPNFSANHLIVSGCADSVIRIWRLESIQHNISSLKSQTCPVMSCFGHTATVNSLVFDLEGTKMYSGDGAGVVRIWSWGGEKYNSKGENVSIAVECIKVISLDYGVRSLSVNPTGRKVLIFLTTNELHLLDTRIHRLMTKFTGIPNTSKNKSEILTLEAKSSPLSRAIFTPCGTYVFAGGPDGRVYVWKAETGILKHVYNISGVNRQVVDITFHPWDHFVAFSSWGNSYSAGGHQPVSVYTWDENQNDSIDSRISVVAKNSMGLPHLSQLSLADAIPEQQHHERKKSTVDVKIRALRDAADEVIQKMVNTSQIPKDRIRAYKGEGRISVID
ncbi:WD40-repeat-containing domain protein [Obelidium mucronatum]|nr:WD40-repeat-containing domain protein [Obelidium mucronatum]